MLNPTTTYSDEEPRLRTVPLSRIAQGNLGARAQNSPWGTFVLNQMVKDWIKEMLPGKPFPLVFQNFAGEVDLEFTSSSDAIMFKMRWYE